MIPSEYQTMLISWAVVGVWIAFVIATNYKNQPRALFYLFMVELWERFSYYGMRAFLVLYLTKVTLGGFGFSEKVGVSIYAAYGALVYLTPLAGGYLADKILGFRRAIIWGAILMAAGQFTLSASTDNRNLMYVGLALLVIGNGFFKPNISSLVGKFYGQDDPRRDGGFTIFYMGINMGAFLAPLTCGSVAELEGWKYGFMLAGTGMVVGLLLFLYTVYTGVLEGFAEPPVKPVVREGVESSAVELRSHPFSTSLLVYFGSLVIVPLAAFLIHQNDVIDYLLGAIGLAAIGTMIGLSFQYPVVDRQRIWVIIVLLVFTTVFWTFFELAGSALTLFTDKNVSKDFLGQKLTTSNFQATNAFFIMVFAPVFSVLWVKLAKSGLEPSAPVKFAIGLFLLGLGFLVLNLGEPVAVDAIVPAIFLILLYLFHTLGELALSPVGLSLVTKLAPAQIVGFMMGFWFLSSAIAHQAGKFIAGESVAPENATPQETLELSLAVFNNVGLFAIGSAVVLLALSPIIKRWMHGVK